MPEFFLSPTGIFLFVSISLILGSFLNVCIVRLPKEESVVFPPSHCVQCNGKIQWYDNIPLLSYVLLRGKCRFCGARFSSRYFLVEALTPILFALAVWKHPFWQAWPFDAFFMSALIISTFIDLEHWIIPDEVTIPGIVLGIINSFVVQDISPIDSFAGMLFGGGSLLLVSYIYLKWKNVEGIGGGDIKFLAMAGAYLGVAGATVTLAVSSLVGSIVGLIYIAVTGKNSKTALPFGPFIALGMLTDFLFHREIVSWFFNVR